MTCRRVMRFIWNAAQAEWCRKLHKSDMYRQTQPSKSTERIFIGSPVPLQCLIHITRSSQKHLLREVYLRCREAQEEGDYAACFLLCAEICKLLETMQKLSATGELFASINRLYADTVARLEATLSSTCADFEEVQYSKVT